MGRNWEDYFDEDDLDDDEIADFFDPDEDDEDWEIEIPSWSDL